MILTDIKTIVNEYFTSWNDSFISKNPDPIRYWMSRQFIGYWSYSGLVLPEQYGYQYDLERVLVQYGKAEKSFEAALIAERDGGNEYIVSGREKNLIDGVPHYAQCMFLWRKEEKGWKLLREYIELEK
ncbi:DUF4440 domain-containing protein [Bacillus sp. 1P06AnD]|uniref:DUF4440 domain-containing protein n=1 Tax=Bacillus sp. 1P06AnD TaxID=3132208 RepID=UPI00399F2D78